MKLLAPSMPDNPVMCPRCGKMLEGLDRLPAEEVRRAQILALLNEGLELYSRRERCLFCQVLEARN